MDIVERLKFDATRCELQFSKGVAGNISEAADEIERLRAQLAEYKAIVTNVCFAVGHRDHGLTLSNHEQHGSE